MAHSSSHRLTAEERKASILQAAAALFAEKGYKGATTRELAAAAGITEPVLYEHFSSKRELYEAIVETKSRQRMERGTAALTPYLEAKDDETLFLEMGRFVMEETEKDPDFLRFLMQVGLEGGELSALYYERHISSAFDLLASYIETRIRDGAFRRVDARVAARAVLSTLAHQTVLMVLFGDRELKQNWRTIVAGMMQLFLHGLRQPARVPETRQSL